MNIELSLIEKLSLESLIEYTLEQANNETPERCQTKQHLESVLKKLKNISK